MRLTAQGPHGFVFFIGGGGYGVIRRARERRVGVHTGVWKDEPTDGGERVVSGQYRHGPVSPNINRGPELCFCFEGPYKRREQKGNKTESELWGKIKDRWCFCKRGRLSVGMMNNGE